MIFDSKIEIKWLYMVGKVAQGQSVKLVEFMADQSHQPQTFCYTAEFSTTCLCMLKTKTFLHIPSQNHQQAP